MSGGWVFTLLVFAFVMGFIVGMVAGKVFNE